MTGGVAVTSTVVRVKEQRTNGRRTSAGVFVCRCVMEFFGVFFSAAVLGTHRHVPSEVLLISPGMEALYQLIGLTV